eukprot:946787-Alexandrium_andersonii.AAC.1
MSYACNPHHSSLLHRVHCHNEFGHASRRICLQTAQHFRGITIAKLLLCTRAEQEQVQVWEDGTRAVPAAVG